MSEPASGASASEPGEPPHARPVFRGLAGGFAILSLMVPLTVFDALWHGEPLPDTSAFGGIMEALLFALTAGAFAAVAVTGRVPMWLFRLWIRVR